MISDEEKARIIERVQLENLIRTELAKGEKEEAKTTRWSWLQSKFGLLIIGALISGILVPTFQFTQETIRWARQNRYDNLKYNLEITRNQTRELTLIHAFVAEAYNRTYSLISSKAFDKKAVESYRNRMVEMHNRRFVQNAKFSAFLIYLPKNERDAIRESFQYYLSSVERFMMLLENAIASKDTTSNYTEKGGTVTSGFGASAKILMDQINENYKEVHMLIQQYLRRIQNESASYM